jgi:YD repeat-containing protein
MANENDSHTYDDENRLTSVSGGHTATLSYDPLGRLWQVISPSGGASPRLQASPGCSRSSILYDGDAMVLEYDGYGNILNRYVHGSNAAADDPLVWYSGSGISSTSRRYLHADHEGSIVATSDGSGANASINTYDEYGIPGSATAAVRHSDKSSGHSPLAHLETVNKRIRRPEGTRANLRK